MRTYMAAVSVLLALAGCVRTIHPLYTAEDLAYDPGLVGAWVPEDGNQDERWEFREGEGEAYTLLHTDEDGRKGRLTVHLLKLGGQRFLDLSPGQPKGMNSFYQMHMQPVHSFLKVESIEPLRLAPMLPDWLENYLEEHPDALAYEDPETGPAVLTASTRELQDFVREHVDTEKAWGKVVEFRRVKGGDKSSGGERE